MSESIRAFSPKEQEQTEALKPRPAELKGMSMHAALSPDFPQLPSKGSSSLLRQKLLALQRSIGNRRLRELIQRNRSATTSAREAEAFPARNAAIMRQPAPQAASLSPALLHQVGLDAINTYYGAAVRGIDLFVRDMSDYFNWAAFWGSLAGNLIWAAACFETGGTAFAISVGGIGLGTAASLTNPTKEGFSAAAETRTTELVTSMRNQVSATGDEVAAQGSAATPAWDENRTRLELLRRIGFRRDEIVVATGGLPDVDAPTITARTRSALLLKANEERMGVIGLTGGDAIYKYDLANYLESHYLGVTHSAKPVSDWQASFHSSEVFLPEGGDDALANIRRGMPGPVHVADWPIAKTIVVPADTTRRLQLEYVMIHLDAKNQLRSVELEGVFKDYAHDNSISWEDYGRQVIAKVWGTASSRPPDIP